jgi:hypothetical protein
MIGMKYELLEINFPIMKEKYHKNYKLSFFYLPSGFLQNDRFHLLVLIAKLYYLKNFSIVSIVTSR